MCVCAGVCVCVYKITIDIEESLSLLSESWARVKLIMSSYSHIMNFDHYILYGKCAY